MHNLSTNCLRPSRKTMSAFLCPIHKLRRARTFFLRIPPVCQTDIILAQRLPPEATAKKGVVRVFGGTPLRHSNRACRDLKT